MTAKPAALNDPLATEINLAGFEASFIRRTKDSSIKDESLARFATDVVDEAGATFGISDGARTDACGHEAIKLLSMLDKEHNRPLTEKALHASIFKCWNKTKEVPTETAMANVLLERPSYFGIGPRVEYWESLVSDSLSKCFDQARLLRLLRLATKESNQVLVEKVIARWTELADMPFKLFTVACINALGDNPNTLPLVQKNVIAYIERVAQLTRWKFNMGFTICGLKSQEVAIIYPDTIEVRGELYHCSKYRDTAEQANENQIENKARLEAWWAKLDISKKPRGSTCIVRLVVEGLPFNIRLD